MKKYKVKFWHKGKRYELEITAGGSGDAKDLVKDQYPGCSMVEATEVKH